MKAEDLKSYESGTLRAFFTLLLDSGMKVYGMTYHQKDGKSWVSFPSKAYQAEDGTTKYQPILRIEDDDRYRCFQKQALVAVEAVMTETESEEVAF
jgi:hypothetical protein